MKECISTDTRCPLLHRTPTTRSYTSPMSKPRKDNSTTKSLDADNFSERRTWRASTRYSRLSSNLYVCLLFSVTRCSQLDISLSCTFCRKSDFRTFTMFWYLCDRLSLQFRHDVLPTTVCGVSSTVPVLKCSRFVRFRYVQLTLVTMCATKLKLIDPPIYVFHCLIVLPSYSSMQSAARAQEALYPTCRRPN